jgi:putative Holliday junction resolvase
MVSSGRDVPIHRVPLATKKNYSPVRGILFCIIVKSGVPALVSCCMNSDIALGIDLGEARVGLAMTDDLGLMAHPLTTWPAREEPLIPRLQKLIREKKVGTVVVGWPRNMDGSRGPAAEKARVFRDELAAAEPELRVVLWDERLTTVAASRSLSAAGKNMRQQKGLIDQAAAQLILQGWLDARDLGTLP